MKNHQTEKTAHLSPMDRPEATLTEQLVGHRDRVRSLIPILNSIKDGLSGSGKSALEGSSLKGQATKPPESIEQLLGSLGEGVSEVGTLVDQIYRKL